MGKLPVSIFFQRKQYPHFFNVFLWILKGNYDRWHAEAPNIPSISSETSSAVSFAVGIILTLDQVSDRGEWVNNETAGYVQAYDNQYPGWGESAEQVSSHSVRIECIFQSVELSCLHFRLGAVLVCLPIRCVSAFVHGQTFVFFFVLASNIFVISSA